MEFFCHGVHMFPSSTELSYFFEVATELHFSRAAIKLQVSQPTLSQAIKRLEQTVGTHLFMRHNQGVTLTRAGVELFKNVKKLQTAWDETLENIEQVTQSVKGSVCIGCHSTLAPFLNTMVADLLQQYPDLEIHFKHELTPQILEDIIHGHVDIGLTTDPYPHPNVILQPIAETEFAFWMSTSRPVTLNLFADDTVIICDTQLPPTQYLLKELQKQIQTDKLRLTTMNQIESIAAMTAGSNNIAILPTGFTSQYYPGKLIKVPNTPIYIKPLCLSYRAENKKIAAIQMVLKAIREVARQTRANIPDAVISHY